MKEKITNCPSIQTVTAGMFAAHVNIQMATDSVEEEVTTAWGKTSLHCKVGEKSSRSIHFNNDSDS